MEMLDRARIGCRAREVSLTASCCGPNLLPSDGDKDRQKGCYVYLLDRVLGFDGENMISLQFGGVGHRAGEQRSLSPGKCLHDRTISGLSGLKPRDDPEPIVVLRV